MPKSNEIRLVGRAVSRGVGIGTARCLYGSRRQFFRRQLHASDVDAEIQRFNQAAESARASIAADISTAVSGQQNAVVELFESHALILSDFTLISKIVDAISRENMNAEWAVQVAFDEFASRMQGADGHIREKYLDLQDVAERLIDAMGRSDETQQFEPGSVIIASELRASTLLQLRDAKVAGIVTELGGWTSHYSILAREFEIPAVSGVAHVFRSISDGDLVSVDGFQGEVRVNPTEKSLTELKLISQEKRSSSRGTVAETGQSLTTLDGRSIIVRTNTNTVESFRSVANLGVQGIGLYRSESLIGRYGRVPSEDEQTEEYAAIANAVGKHGVCVRMFDIEGESFAGASSRRQKNPALGLRAIRLSFRERDLLLPQMRAILRASAGRNVSIIVPMVSGASEMSEFRNILEQQQNDLERNGVEIGQPPLGAMIEIPSAALVTDQLASVSDFLCLGTNDLAQYVLAADRDNESVSEWFRTLHPAMLRIVRSVIESSRKARKQLIVCGEMAGSPFYAPVLVGLGADDLSMSPGSVEAVRRVISGIAFEEAAALVREISDMTTPHEIEEAVLAVALKKWSHLYPPEFLAQRSG